MRDILRLYAQSIGQLAKDPLLVWYRCYFSVPNSGLQTTLKIAPGAADELMQFNEAYALAFASADAEESKVGNIEKMLRAHEAAARMLINTLLEQLKFSIGSQVAATLKTLFPPDYDAKSRIERAEQDFLNKLEFDVLAIVGGELSEIGLTIERIITVQFATLQREQACNDILTLLANCKPDTIDSLVLLVSEIVEGLPHNPEGDALRVRCQFVLEKLPSIKKQPDEQAVLSAELSSYIGSNAFQEAYVFSEGQFRSGAWSESYFSQQNKLIAGAETRYLQQRALRQALAELDTLLLSNPSLPIDDDVVAADDAGSHCHMPVEGLDLLLQHILTIEFVDSNREWRETFIADLWNLLTERCPVERLTLLGQHVDNICASLGASSSNLVLTTIRAALLHVQLQRHSLQGGHSSGLFRAADAADADADAVLVPRNFFG